MGLSKRGLKVCCPFLPLTSTSYHVSLSVGQSVDDAFRSTDWVIGYKDGLNSLIQYTLGLLRPTLQWFSRVFWVFLQAAHGGTIPPHVLVTTYKPDIFLLNESMSSVIIFELTCPWDRNIDRSHEFKEEKYATLVTDLSQNYSVSLFSVEISSRGLVTPANRARIKAFLFKCCTNAKSITKPAISICSKASLLSSYSLFSARNEPSWNSPAPLKVRF